MKTSQERLKEDIGRDYVYRTTHAVSWLKPNPTAQLVPIDTLTDEECESILNSEYGLAIHKDGKVVAF